MAARALSSSWFASLNTSSNVWGIASSEVFARVWCVPTAWIQILEESRIEPRGRHVSPNLCSCALAFSGFGARFFFGARRLFSELITRSSKTEKNSLNVCSTADPEFGLGHEISYPLFSAQEGCKGRLFGTGRKRSLASTGRVGCVAKSTQTPLFVAGSQEESQGAMMPLVEHRACEDTGG